MLSYTKQQHVTIRIKVTEHALTSCDFSESDILQIINQDSNKAYGHDVISIRMLNHVVRQSAGL